MKTIKLIGALVLIILLVIIYLGLFIIPIVLLNPLNRLYSILWVCIYFRWILPIKVKFK